MELIHLSLGHKLRIDCVRPERADYSASTPHSCKNREYCNREYFSDQTLQNNTIMLAPIASIYRLILPEFRFRFFGVIGLSIVVALFEMIGIASIMPLIAVIVDPEGVSNNRLLSILLAALGSEGNAPSVHVIGFITITLIICTNAATLALNWMSVKFSAQLAIALSEQFAYALFQKPFEYFLAHPAAELAHETCNEVAKFASGGVLQLSFAVVRAIQLVLVLALLFALSPLFTLIVLPVIGALYAFSFRYSAHRLGTLGSQALASTGRAMHGATEMYEMAREISLKGDCSYFVRRISVFLKKHIALMRLRAFCRQCRNTRWKLPRCVQSLPCLSIAP